MRCEEREQWTLLDLPIRIHDSLFLCVKEICFYEIKDLAGKVGMTSVIIT